MTNGALMLKEKAIMILPALFRLDLHIVAEPTDLCLLLLDFNLKLKTSAFVDLSLWRQSPLKAVWVLYVDKMVSLEICEL